LGGSISWSIAATCFAFPLFSVTILIGLICAAFSTSIDLTSVAIASWSCGLAEITSELLSVLYAIVTGTPEVLAPDVVDEEL
jgi:hypothetical protein